MKMLIYEEYDAVSSDDGLVLKRTIKKVMQGERGVYAINVMPTQPFVAIHYYDHRYVDYIPLGNVKAYRTSESTW